MAFIKNSSSLISSFVAKPALAFRAIWLIFVPMRLISAYKSCSSLGGRWRIVTPEMSWRNTALTGRPETAQICDSEDEKNVIGVLLMTVSTENIVSNVSKVAEKMSFYGLMIIGVLILCSILFVVVLMKPFGRLQEMLNKVADGNLDESISENTYKETWNISQAVQSTITKLRTVDQSREEFVSNVSHELKTPMTTIGGYVDGILDGTIPKETEKHYLQIVSSEVRRLSRLVRSMLDLSRIQAQGLDESRKSRFDLGEAMSDVLITFEQKINARALQVSVDLPEKPVWTKADRDAITQVIYNLLDNAIKFCPVGGSLALVLEQDGQKARLRVRNTGQTIPAEELPLLFDRFHKADKARSADREGWGLGLYIAKTIVGAHGGEIWATSENGVTEFCFTLPVVR
mgnify:CR=1 FL=1